MPETLDIPEHDTNQDLLDLLEQAKQDGKVLRVTRDGKEPMYVQYLYPRKYHDDGDEVYYATSRSSWGGSFGSKRSFHDSIVDMQGATVALIDLDEVDDDGVQKSLQKYEQRGHPFDEVYVFVKSVDDGRYKDDFRFVREGKEYRMKGYDTALEKWRDQDNYIEIGTFGEVREMDGDEYRFDFKQWSGSVSLDLSALADDRPADIVKEKLEGQEPEGGD